jgi:serine/threonine-protein kinase
LHQTLVVLRESVPADAFAVGPRWYPLDPACNPALGGESRRPVRCLAAKAAICLEGQPDAQRFVGELFEQESLTPERVFELASPWMPVDRLEDCIDSAETEARLRSDLEWAEAHAIRGTPLVLVNGRKALPYPPLLYALVLTGGSASHPVFAALPPPRPVGR